MKRPPFARKALAPPLQSGAPLGLVPDADLTTRFAALEGFVAKLKADGERDQNRIAELERQLEAPSIVAWVPLKKACGDRALRYDTGLKWAKLGYVMTKRVGARWLVDPMSLDAAITSRL